MVAIFTGDKTTKLYKILALFSLSIILITSIYGIVMAIYRAIEVVGETLVDVEFPPIHIFPFFYMKPVTWLNFAIITLTYSSLELGTAVIAKLSEFKKNLIKLSLFVLGSLAVYETLFNFTLWSGLISRDSIKESLNPDLIINPFPNPDIPWNIVFSTKLYLAILIICVYTFYFIKKIESNSK